MLGQTDLQILRRSRKLTHPCFPELTQVV